MKKKIFKIIFLILPLIIFIIFSFLNLKNAELISDKYNNFLKKQFLWDMIGFIFIVIILFIKPKILFKYSFFYYLIGNLLLIFVLIFGDAINGAKAWLDFGFFSIQPSEIMKVFLLLYLCEFISKRKKNKQNCKEEFLLIIKSFIIVLIPSIITFLEPDTGAIMVYFAIYFAILFFSNFKKRWFIVFLILVILGTISFLYLYFKQENIFIKVFGTKFFYRMDRIIDFKNNQGLQLENALIALGSSGLFGHGINKVALYFPEAPTDFAFALLLSNCGFIGGCIVIINIIIIDINILNIMSETKKKKYKYFCAGFLGALFFGQLQNILMNLGLLPIMGITLPFISYGGSSTIVYLICIGIILKILTVKKKEEI